MQIISKGEIGTCSLVLAQVQNTNPTSPTLTDSAPQGSSVSGGIDTNNLTSSILTLTRPTDDILCGDKGYYECSVTYQDAKRIIYTVRNNQTLSMYGKYPRFVSEYSV